MKGTDKYWLGRGFAGTYSSLNAWKSGSGSLPLRYPGCVNPLCGHPTEHGPERCSGRPERLAGPSLRSTRFLPAKAIHFQARTPPLFISTHPFTTYVSSVIYAQAQQKLSKSPSHWERQTAKQYRNHSCIMGNNSSDHCVKVCNFNNIYYIIIRARWEGNTTALRLEGAQSHSNEPRAAIHSY